MFKFNLVYSRSLSFTARRRRDFRFLMNCSSTVGLLEPLSSDLIGGKGLPTAAVPFPLTSRPNAR